MRIFQKGFNYNQDGPGNRLVYHLQGCNMHCIWCSNPEGMKIDEGKLIENDEIVKECIKSKLLFFDNGGVTFTGGEATIQFNDLKDVLIKLKQNNIQTALETNGTSIRLKELLPYIDYLIMDFKHFDSVELKRFTGLGNEIIKENIEYISKNNYKLHIRTPLIKNINTKDVQGFIDYFKSIDTKNFVFEFLPYHEYGKEKWKEKYLVEDGFINNQILEEFISKFEENNLKVVKT